MPLALLPIAGILKSKKPMKRIIVILAACILLVGCTTTKFVPVIETHTDTVRITKHQRDSIFLRDSIYVNQYQNGDTVFLSIEKWHTQYRDRLLHDTAYISRRDSVPVPYPVEKEVAAKLSWWQNLRLWIGNIVLIALAVLAGWWLLRKRLPWKIF